jgi:hypothetical protein
VLRAGWSKYKRGCETSILEEKCNKRLGEIKLRLEWKTKRRMFNAIHSFASTFLKARSFLHGIIRKKDKRNKQTAYKLWQSFNLGLVIEQQAEEQAQQVGELHELR